MDKFIIEKIDKAIATGHVFKTTDQDLMFYHVIDKVGRTVVQLTVPYSGLGVHEVRYQGSRVMYVNWHPEYDFIDQAELIHANKAQIARCVMACDKKIRDQIIKMANKQNIK